MAASDVLAREATAPVTAKTGADVAVAGFRASRMVAALRAVGRLLPDQARGRFAVLMRLAPATDFAAASAAWNRVVAAQPALRSILSTDAAGRPIFHALPEPAWPVLSASDLAANAAELETDRTALPALAGLLARPSASEPAAEFVRAAWVSSRDGQPFVLVDLHDAMSDGFGAALLPRLFEAALLGQDLPPTGDFARLCGDRGGQAAPRATDPAVPDAAYLHRDGVGERLRQSRALRRPLDADLWPRLEALARTESVSTFALGWTAFALLLERLAGGPVPAWLPSQRRRRAADYATIGHGVALLRLVANAAAAPSFLAAARSARQRIVAAVAAGSDAVPEAGLPGYVFEIADQDAQLRRLLPALGLGQRVLWSRRLTDRLEGWDVKLVLRPPRDGDAGEAQLIFDPGSLSEVRAGSLLDAYLVLLRAALADPAQAPAALPLAERREAAPPWPSRPATAWDAVAGAPTDLAAVFDAVLARAPAAPAMRWADGAMDFAETDDAARQIAALLRNRGAGPGALVAFRLEGRAGPEHRALFVAVQLACYRIGAALLPLGQQLPPAQARAQIEALGAGFVFTAVSPCDAAPGWAATARTDAIPRFPGAALLSREGGPAPAIALPPGTGVVLTTSGTTGVPKAICLTHAMLVGLLRGVVASGTVPPLSFLMGANIGFDMALADVWLSWAHAQPVVLLGTERRTPAALAEARALGAAVVSLSPTVAAASLREAPDCFVGFHTLMLVGETLPRGLARRLAEAAPHLAVVNGYGPSEMAILTTLCRVRAADEGPVPIGRVLPGYQLRIAEPRSLAPLPPHWPGEIVIAAAAPAAGYVDTAMTAARFLDLPDDAPGRFFRTGDLGWVDGDGEVQFIGRNDRQAKVAGVRIELDGVEHAIAAVPGVAAVATVVVAPRGAPLVAAVVQPAPDAAPPPALREVILERCRAWLPRAAVPRRLLFVDAMPTGGSGKTAHRALAALLETADDAPDTAPSRPPEPGSIEARLAELWTELLVENGLPGVAIMCDDDVFGLGVTSLDALSMAERIEREFGRPFPDDQIFVRPTIALQAALLRDTANAPGALDASGLAWRLVRPARPGAPSRGLALGLPGLKGSAGPLGVVAAQALRRFDIGAFAATRDQGDLLRDAAWEAVAHAIVARILAGDVPSPSLLVGFSFSGWLAWVVDRLLVAAGQPPRPVINLDGGALHLRRPAVQARLRDLLAGDAARPPTPMLLVHRAAPGGFVVAPPLARDWSGERVALRTIALRTLFHSDVTSAAAVRGLAPALAGFAADPAGAALPAPPVLAGPGAAAFAMLAATAPPSPDAVHALTAPLPDDQVQSHAGPLLFLALAAGDPARALALARRLRTGKRVARRLGAYAEAALLAQAGRTAEATAQAQAWLARQPRDAAVVRRAAGPLPGVTDWAAINGLDLATEDAIDVGVAFAARSN